MRVFILFLVASLTMFMTGCQSKMSDDEIIRNMPTEKLVQACLDSPEWALISLYNHPMSAYAKIQESYIGFQELFRRDDALAELLIAYEKNDPLDIGSDWTDLQKGQYAFQFNKIEYLFTSVVQKSDIDDLRQLKEPVIAKYRQKKIMVPEIYSVENLSLSVFLCLDIIKKVSSDILEGNDDIDYFMFYIMPKANNMVDAIQFLDSMVELFENFEL